MDSIEESDKRVRARARARATLLTGIAIVALGIIAGAAFTVGTILRGHDRDVQVTHTAIVAQHAVATANRAQILSQQNSAMIFATCRAFARRDKANAEYSHKLDILRIRYANDTSAFYRAAAPVFAARDVTLAKIAAGDCNALMRKAISDSTLPPGKRPTPAPL